MGGQRRRKPRATGRLKPVLSPERWMATNPLKGGEKSIPGGDRNNIGMEAGKGLMCGGNQKCRV